MTMFSRRNTKARKLTGLEVQEIRKAYEQGETQGALARKYRMSVGQIGRIVRGESWGGTAVLSPQAADEVLAHLLAVQERVTLVRAAPPPSLLDGGDVPDETQGEGVAALTQHLQELPK